ncbi:NlpC/P60 family protein [Chelativorans alearense]|uniref:NlpC/P60 family protein n=1 Tax=Chelativorans alearense TaxID=2681495 RepID=UPI0013D4C57E
MTQDEWRKTIVAEARSWIGTAYHGQASAKGAGCDCVGLVRGVLRGIGGVEPEKVPPYTGDWGDVTGTETVLEAARRHLVEIPPAQAQAGDVVAFRVRRGRIARHCGILTGDGRFIHAWEASPVCEVALGDWWRRRIVAAFAFPFELPRGRTAASRLASDRAPETSGGQRSLPRPAAEGQAPSGGARKADRPSRTFARPAGGQPPAGGGAAVRQEGS